MNWHHGDWALELSPTQSSLCSLLALLSKDPWVKQAAYWMQTMPVVDGPDQKRTVKTKERFCFCIKGSF
jgi:hypothetical protein